MTPLQQAERVIEELVGILDLPYSPMLMLKEAVPESLEIKIRTALAAIRASQNQSDAGAVIDACEKALWKVMDLASDWACAAGSCAHPLSGHNEVQIEQWAKADLSALVSAALETIRAYRDSREAGPWQSMESAPTNDPILGRGTFRHPPLNGHIKDIHYVEMKWSDFWKTWSDPNGHAFNPTGWMPLPPPPTPETENKAPNLETNERTPS